VPTLASRMTLRLACDSSRVLLNVKHDVNHFCRSPQEERVEESSQYDQQGDRSTARHTISGTWNRACCEARQHPAERGDSSRYLEDYGNDAKGWIPSAMRMQNRLNWRWLRRNTRGRYIDYRPAGAAELRTGFESRRATGAETSQWTSPFRCQLSAATSSDRIPCRTLPNPDSRRHRTDIRFLRERLPRAQPLPRNWDKT
jgi:hypothetical protein